MESLFIYGTLRDIDVQQRVIGRRLTSCKDCLRGYRRSTLTIEGTAYPCAVPDPKERIEGKVIEITPEELASIDAYETPAYERIRVELESTAQAWVYVQNTIF